MGFEPTDAAKYCSLVRKSGLVTDECLDHWLQHQPQALVDQTGDTVAASLVRAGLLLAASVNRWSALQS